MRRFAVWKLMAAVAVLAVLLGTLVVPVGKRLEFLRLKRKIDTFIVYLRPTDPKGVDAAVWACAHRWTVTAYGNVCSSPEYVPAAEMDRLRDDLDRKLSGNVDVDTLAWIWDRLAQTGPYGSRYVERFRPQFEECFPAKAGTASSPKP
jgi:hypothetical protein